jgi:hypothetical protein
MKVSTGSSPACTVNLCLDFRLSSFQVLWYILHRKGEPPFRCFCTQNTLKYLGDSTISGQILQQGKALLQDQVINYSPNAGAQPMPKAKATCTREQ